jgi:hypothetical protein
MEGDGMNEKELKNSGELILMQARRIEPIDNNDQYAGVVDFCRRIKQYQDEVVRNFKQMKEDAHRTHKTICDKEKEFLVPATNAERIAKQLMADWKTRSDAERKRLEAELVAQRQAAIAENERLAQQYEADGNTIQAQMLRSASALVADTIGEMLPDEKVSGVSYSGKWVAIVDDATQVPAYFNGAELRTISTSALNTLARLTQGTAQVPGVRFVKDAIVSVKK